MSTMAKWQNAHVINCKMRMMAELQNAHIPSPGKLPNVRQISAYLSLLIALLGSRAHVLSRSEDPRQLN